MSERLDRIESLLATVAESNAARTARLDRIEEGLSRTEKIVEANARAIAAYDARRKIRRQQRKERLAAEETRWLGTRKVIDNTKKLVADLGRQRQEANQRFEMYLAESRAARAEMRADREANEAEHREWQKQFEQSIQARAEEHQVFLQNVQVLLAEIARLRGD